MAFQVGAFQPAFQQIATSTGQTPAGRPSRAKRKRYFVEIDGETFEVRSPEHAQALLERAREVAQAHATEVAQQVVPQKRKTGSKPVPLPTPAISSPDPELQPLITQARKAINEIYRQAAIDAELAFLMALKRQRELDDDDEEFLLLM